jgi:aspartokinase-like uncharacterized kinase
VSFLLPESSRDGSLWVVKLGGSLAESVHLPHWLEALSQTNAVIVPGGGPFADAVRQAQAHWHFDELTAHHMAVLAMRQYGRMLAGLCPALRTATTLEELAGLSGSARIWLPLPELLDAAGIPASWDITSDSLAAWLAGEIDAANLLLVKSVSLDESAEKHIDCTDMVNKQWVDPVFPAYAAKSACRIWLSGPDGHVMLAQALANPGKHLIPIPI